MVSTYDSGSSGVSGVLVMSTGSAAASSSRHCLDLDHLHHQIGKGGDISITSGAAGMQALAEMSR